jgi:hypothetical protein
VTVFFLPSCSILKLLHSYSDFVGIDSDHTPPKEITSVQEHNNIRITDVCKLH